MERIEEVDYVWNGGDYCTLTGKANYYDYILASHLIEHTTDFIGFFEQCAALLKDDGILSLAVPNKYYSFDFFRENTSLSQVIDKHFSDQNHHSKGGILEYFTGAVKLDGHIAWNQRIFQESSDFSFIHEKGQGLKFAESRDFFDIHEWVFTPGSFRILINDLWELGYIDFHEKSFYVDGENSCEFIITLKKAASPVNMAFDQKTRMELRQYRMKEELAFWESVKQFEFSDKLRFQ